MEVRLDAARSEPQERLAVAPQHGHRLFGVALEKERPGLAGQQREERDASLVEHLQHVLRRVLDHQLGRGGPMQLDAPAGQLGSQRIEPSLDLAFAGNSGAVGAHRHR